MDRIYRMVSSFTDEQSLIGLEKLSSFELSQVTDIMDDYIIIDLKYNGEVCHGREGDLNYSVLFVPQSKINIIKSIETKVHEGLDGYTVIDDITEDILYEKFDTSVFGFFEFEMNFEFFKYRKDYLTKDIILDKILKYGKDSLTENEKLFLGDKQMISPIDEI